MRDTIAHDFKMIMAPCLYEDPTPLWLRSEAKFVMSDAICRTFHNGKIPHDSLLKWNSNTKLQ